MLPILKRRAIEFRFRLNALRARFLRYGSAAYRRRTAQELDHFSDSHSDSYNDRCLEPSPPVWDEMQKRAASLIRRATGHDTVGYLVNRVSDRPDARMLSLGSGPAGLEFMVSRQAPLLTIDCLDLNPQLLEAGRSQAAAEGLRVNFEQADLNSVDLPENEYNLIFCHASLHHILEIETLAQQMRKALRANGELVVVDVLTRDGYLMWPENRKLVHKIWKTLPERYRLNHTGYHPRKRVDRKIWEWDTRASGMECLRTEAVLPSLRENFTSVHYVPYFGICRRFFDQMYGPNYDLSRPLDRALVDWIWELDCDMLGNGQLRPETFFGVFR
jgi:ubiquinone/menaquinone biosynthesis C-methylase UbiE